MLLRQVGAYPVNMALLVTDQAEAQPEELVQILDTDHVVEVVLVVTKA